MKASRFSDAQKAFILTQGADGVPGGLVLPEQLGDIPSSFNGYIWVDDIWTVGPSLRPSTERRTREEQLRAREGITRRRERLD